MRWQKENTNAQKTHVKENKADELERLAAEEEGMLIVNIVCILFVEFSAYGIGFRCWLLHGLRVLHRFFSTYSNFRENWVLD